MQRASIHEVKLGTVSSCSNVAMELAQFLEAHRSAVKGAQSRM
jgi:hypothetical protein